MDDQEIRNIITKYLAGEASPQEEHDLRHWVDQQPEHTELFEEMYATWAEIDSLHSTKQFDLNEAWKEIKSRSGISGATPAPVVRSLPMRTLIMRIAAAVVLLVGMGWALYMWMNVAGVQPEMIQLSTQEEKTHIYLPDSSEVWLNAYSELAYEADFSGEMRNVELKGEAFFEVQRNEAKAFIIQAGETQTEVLGTSFNIRAYEQEDYIEVSVSTGKVSFGNAAANLALTAGNQGTFHTTNKRLTFEANRDENRIAWQSGQLIFDNSELSEVADALERFFGMTVSFSSTPLAQCHYSGRFDQPELEYLLEVITATVNMKYAITDGHITFSGQGCE